jgi:hypothetical protein
MICIVLLSLAKSTFQNSFQYCNLTLNPVTTNHNHSEDLTMNQLILLYNSIPSMRRTYRNIDDSSKHEVEHWITRDK